MVSGSRPACTTLPGGEKGTEQPRIRQRQKRCPGSAHPSHGTPPAPLRSPRGHQRCPSCRPSAAAPLVFLPSRCRGRRAPTEQSVAARIEAAHVPSSPLRPSEQRFASPLGKREHVPCVLRKKRPWLNSHCFPAQTNGAPGC